jgi:hypothetical protein
VCVLTQPCIITVVKLAKKKTLVKAIHENFLQDLGLGRSTTVVGISILGA